MSDIASLELLGAPVGQRVTVHGFDFDSLPSDLAASTRARTTRIGGLLRKSLEGFAAIGRELLAAQEELQHGSFLKWVQSMGLSKSNAYRMMDVARHLGRELPSLGSLPIDVAQKIASAPAPARIEIVTALKAKEPLSRAEIENRIYVAKKEAEREAAEAKVTPAEREKKAANRKAAEMRQKREAEKRRAEWAERDARRKAKAQRIADILVEYVPEELVDEISSLVDEAALHDLRSRIIEARRPAEMAKALEAQRPDGIPASTEGGA